MESKTFDVEGHFKSLTNVEVANLWTEAFKDLQENIKIVPKTLRHEKCLAAAMCVISQELSKRKLNVVK